MEKKLKVPKKGKGKPIKKAHNSAVSKSLVPSYTQSNKTPKGRTVNAKAK